MKNIKKMGNYIPIKDSPTTIIQNNYFAKENSNWFTIFKNVMSIIGIVAAIIFGYLNYQNSYELTKCKEEQEKFLLEGNSTNSLKGIEYMTYTDPKPNNNIN